MDDKFSVIKKSFKALVELDYGKNLSEYEPILHVTFTPQDHSYWWCNVYMTFPHSEYDKKIKHPNISGYGGTIENALNGVIVSLKYQLLEKKSAITAVLKEISELIPENQNQKLQLPEEKMPPSLDKEKSDEYGIVDDGMPNSERYKADF